MLTAMGDVMREAYKRGWITTRDGNISVKKTGSDILYITPSGWRKTIIHPEHIIKVKFTPSLAKNIDIIELIREIRFIDIKLFGNSKINNLLQDDSSLASSLEKELDESDFKKLVNNFYQVFDAIVTKIRKKVVDLVDEHLNVMVNNQAEYLTYNNQIFNFLVINRLIRRSQDGQ